MAEKGLFPTFDVPEILEDSQVYEEKYKRSVWWDFEKGDFVRDGANRILYCSGMEAYQAWCVKMAETERFACLSYPEELGVEMEEALKEDSGKAVESAIERTITEALSVNPCTEYVREFSFMWDGDRVNCDFKVKGLEWGEFPLSIVVNKEVVLDGS